MFEAVGFRVQDLFGDYNLNPFEVETAERLILIGRK